MNSYATLTALRDRNPGWSSIDDDLLVQDLIAASREIDSPEGCNRFFFSLNATRYYDGPRHVPELMIDDCLSLSAFTADSEADGTYDGETWTEGTDFYLDAYAPETQFPKGRIRLTPDGNYGFCSLPRYYKLTGLWGYGDGLSATPWAATAITGTVGTTTGTTLTLSAGGTIEAGHTLKIGTEQMFVSAVSGTSATVIRGVNGTTAAIQSAAAISTASYPDLIERACLWLVREYRNMYDHAGYESERMGEYGYKTMGPMLAGVRSRIFGGLVRTTI